MTSDTEGLDNTLVESIFGADAGAELFEVLLGDPLQQGTLVPRPEIRCGTSSRALIELALSHGQVVADAPSTASFRLAPPLPRLPTDLRLRLAREIAKDAWREFPETRTMSARTVRSMDRLVSQRWWLDEPLVRHAVAMRRAELRTWAVRQAHPTLWPYARDLLRHARLLAARSTPRTRAREGLLHRTLVALGHPADLPADTLRLFLGHLTTYLGVDSSNAVPAFSRTRIWENGRLVLVPSTLGPFEGYVECLSPGGGRFMARFNLGFWACYARVALEGVEGYAPATS
ncbi:MAG: hypothetical protein U0353_09395 [Sandaracinus sp.]